ncbi:leucine-rich repeat protein [Anaerovorax odorimutans]|nr:leucine-rich repeat protein [Anaerovorax odorimutans]
MKKKWISLMTSVMMFATILANPAIGAAAEKQSEAKDVQTKTVTSVEPTKAKEEKPEPSKASKATAQAASSKGIAVSEGVTGGNIYFDETTGTITDCDVEVTKVIIPKAIRSVEVKAIGDNAFSGCGLTSITIPNSVTSIGDGAFSECDGLISINVDKDNSKYTSLDGVLFNKLKTNLVQYPIGNNRTNYTIPDGVTNIGNSAFKACYKLININIPSSVISIEYEAFWGCDSLTSITIPNGVTSIGDEAFAWCDGLASIDVDKDNSKYTALNGVLFNKSKTNLIQYPIGNSRTRYTIPDSVVSIGVASFSDCMSLTTITIPNSVTNIESDAFWGCDSLTSIAIPNSVTSIAYHAFFGCNDITIYGYSNSYAESYAQENDIPFIAIGSTGTKPSYKPVEDVKFDLSQSLGKMQLFENMGGSAGNQPITKVFPESYNLNFKAVNTKIKKETMKDGTYKYKMSIGLNENLAFSSDKAWENLKKDINDAKKNVNSTASLRTFMNKWNAPSGFFTITSKFKAKPAMKAAGYYEAICDENGRILTESGGVLLDCQWNAKTTNQWLIGPVPIYVELGGNLKAAVKGGMRKDLENPKLSLTGTVKVTPGISAGAGAGISGAATVGVKGSADIDIRLIPASKGDFTAGIAATAKLIFVFDWEYTLAKKTYPLWNKTKKKQYSLANAGENQELALTDRTYQDKTSVWNGSMPRVRKNSKIAVMRAAESGISSWELQSYILPNTIPKMKKVGDDTVMVFQSNDPDRETANSVKVMYSVYDGNTWSQPKNLWDNGTLDTFSDMEVIDNELYVVWQKCKEVLKGSDANRLSEQAAQTSELCWTKYNPSSKSFAQAQYITNDEKADLMPVLVKDADVPAVMWVSNPENDLIGLDGTKTIYLSKLNGAEWSSPEIVGTTECYISELDGIWHDRKYIAAYIGSLAGNTPSLFTAESGTVVPIAQQGEAVISGLKCKDGTISYNQEGTLKQYNLADQATSELIAGESQMISANAEMFKQGEKTAMIWMANSEEGCSIYSSVKTESGYSEPVELYRDENIIGNYITAVMNTDGSWDIVLNATDNENPEKTSMFFIETANKPKAVLNDVIINESEMEDDLQPISCSVTNDSEETITKLNLIVRNGNETLLNEEILRTILPGETVYLDESIDLNNIDQKATLNIEATAPGQVDLLASVQEEEIQLSDFDVTVEKEVMDNSVKFAATVKNCGRVASGGTVNLYGDAEGKRRIQSESFDVLSPGETTTVELTYPISSMEFNAEQSAYSMIKVETGSEEYNVENNLYYGATYLWELPEDNFNIANFDLIGADGSYTYDGKAIQPAVRVKGLKQGTDYTVSYRNNVNAGRAKVIITGIGIYHGTMAKEYIIQKANQVVTAGSYTKTYGNKPFSLNAGAKSQLSYQSSNPKIATVSSTGKVTIKNTGKAQITITAAATANYNAASKTVTITINPKKAAGLKAKAGKKRMTISWKKDTKASGYQITYAQKKNFKKGKKNVTISKNKTTKRAIKKLKSKKTYYVKVRAYKKAGSQKLYGAYSAVKKVKVK